MANIFGLSANFPWILAKIPWVSEQFCGASANFLEFRRYLPTAWVFATFSWLLAKIPWVLTKNCGFYKNIHFPKSFSKFSWNFKIFAVLHFAFVSFKITIASIMRWLKSWPFQLFRRFINWNSSCGKISSKLKKITFKFHNFLLKFKRFFPNLMKMLLKIKLKVFL